MPSGAIHVHSPALNSHAEFRVTMQSQSSQRGAAATKWSGRHKCVRSMPGTLSRRAERGDFVALGEDASRISGPTVRRQKFRTTRYSAISAKIIRYYNPRAALSWPHCSLPAKRILTNIANSQSENLRKYDRFLTVIILRGAAEPLACDRRLCLSAIIWAGDLRCKCGDRHDIQARYCTGRVLEAGCGAQIWGQTRCLGSGGANRGTDTIFRPGGRTLRAGGAPGLV